MHRPLFLCQVSTYNPDARLHLPDCFRDRVSDATEVALDIKTHDVSIRIYHDYQSPKKQNPKTCYYLSKNRDHMFIYGMCFVGAELRDLVTESERGYAAEDLVPILIAKGGPEIITKLTGNYFIVLVNEDNGSVQCVSSRFGMIPVYYLQAGQNFYISNSLTNLGNYLKYPNLNTSVLAQICLYNYSISDQTLLEDCFSLPQGHCLLYRQGKLSIKKHWSTDQLIGRRICGKRTSIEMIDDAFDRSTRNYINSFSDYALSLTGGWDGRLILAYLLKYVTRSSISLYSFGTKESPDITIPALISNSLKLRYSKIILGAEYLQRSFLACAKQTALNSDGYRSIRRAHYYHAMTQLPSSVKAIITGICGSNVMKSAPNSPSLVFNKDLLRLLTSPMTEEILTEHFHKFSSLLNSDIVKVDKTRFIESVVNGLMKDVLSKNDFSSRYCMFVFNFLERQYFGSEMASYSDIVSNYSPFIDYDFISVLAATPFFNGNKTSKTVFSNWSNGVLYAQLIQSSHPQLNNFVSDKYIKLRELLNPVYYPAISLKQLYRRYITHLGKQHDYYNTANTVNQFCDTFFNDDNQNRKVKSIHPSISGSFITAYYWYNELIAKN